MKNLELGIGKWECGSRNAECELRTPNNDDNN